MRDRVLLALLALLGLSWALVLLASPGASRVAHADTEATQWTVCLDGPPTCDFSSLQVAVDSASNGDTILVARGVYSDLSTRPVPAGYPNPPAGGQITQVVYIDKTLTIRGGYDTTFTEPPDPKQNESILDGRGQGRGMVVAGLVSPVIEGLRIYRGDGADLGGAPGADAGGGVYIISATATIRSSMIERNRAAATITGAGGGMYLYYSDSTLIGNEIVDNMASRSLSGEGGGVALYDSNAVLEHNTIRGNTASASLTAPGQGGGVLIDYGRATLKGNTIEDNVASTGANSPYGRGGGLFLNGSASTLVGNIVRDNVASKYPGGVGGGIRLFQSSDVLRGNRIEGNIASETGNGDGGGLALFSQSNLSNSSATLEGNLIVSNTATLDPAATGEGGGLYVRQANARLSANQVLSNTADWGGGLYLEGPGSVSSSGEVVRWNTAASGEGSGLAIIRNAPSLTNPVVADNVDTGAGNGLKAAIYVAGATPRFFHLTLARHAGDGLYVGSEGATDSTVVLSNTLIYDHDFGIVVYSPPLQSNRVELYTTLAQDNATLFQGLGPGNSIIDDNQTLSGAPDFVADGYHLGPGSAAIDQGIDAGVGIDVDGQRRPLGSGYDIGADEYGQVLYLPLVVRQFP